VAQNPSTGDSGACYGDSGGPNFLGDSQVIASIGALRGDVRCVPRRTRCLFFFVLPSCLPCLPTNLLTRTCARKLSQRVAGRGPGRFSGHGRLGGRAGVADLSPRKAGDSNS
jgi:hypothetical protein